ncbi:hypothetical protein SELMODRAFT_228264 [Selaginella moellendorffii]|uniref:DUF599 domain-containing protein n=1 Tax=Selaginella moellendorffii TaxID=88036 RepID=D8RTQ0_SELML|nr:hypothetical protein SELMODRAFT_228264 [Selaginella moellendorffii]
MAAAWKQLYFDVLLVPAGLLLLLAYHVFYFYKVRRHPLKTVVGVNHLGRTAWVHSIMKDNDKKNILAVQTLRNSIMASTLMASTAILLSSGLAAFLSSSYSVKRPLHGFSSTVTVLGAHDDITIATKFVALLACFLFSFICYMQSVRFTNHVGFLINTPVTSDSKITPDYVAAVLARGSNFYTVGTRGYYFAFPLLLWLFGPIPVVVACLLLVPFLYRLDLVTDDQC